MTFSDEQEIVIWGLEGQIRMLQERLCGVDAVVQKLSKNKCLHSVWVGKNYSLAQALEELEQALGYADVPDTHESGEGP